MLKMINIFHRYYYWQHCPQCNTSVFKLLRGRFWGFSPHRDNTLHQWGWTSMPNFTPTGATI